MVRPFFLGLRIPAVQAGSQPGPREEECEDIARAGGRHQALHCPAGPSGLQPQVISCRPIHRVADPHHFNANPDQDFHFNANPDPVPNFYFNADPDLNPAPLVYRTSRAPFWVSTPLFVSVHFLSFDFNGDPDPFPAFHSNANPDLDPASKTIRIRSWREGVSLCPLPCVLSFGWSVGIIVESFRGQKKTKIW